MRTVAILGATGSIGNQTLDLLRRYPDRFRAVALAGGSRAEPLFELVREFRPQMASLVREPEAIPDDLRFCEWRFGPDAAARLVAECQPDDVVEAVVGVAGLSCAMTALTHAKRLLLANKEALVTGGHLVMGLSKKLGRPVIPVDSEHSAIYQCLKAAQGNPVEKLILTASGGPFRTWDKDRIHNATLSEALAHPTWRMGKKITVDCATMMNKGLEIMEAGWLFGMPEDRIDVAVHPESVVHSMIQFADGAVLSQMGAPDMRGPISYALGEPERLPYQARPLTFDQMTLHFDAPDMDKFPCLRLARHAFAAGGSAPVTLNGANEAAVERFLMGGMPFGRIAEAVDYAIQHAEAAGVDSVEAVYEADSRARSLAREYLEGRR